MPPAGYPGKGAPWRKTAKTAVLEMANVCQPLSLKSNVDLHGTT